MKKSVIAMAGALGVAGAVIVAPTANAAPCTASGLATTASGVLAEAGGFLEAHPGANNVLTGAATQPAEEAKAAVKGYFSANVGEYLELRRIAGPLKDMRSQCGIAITPTQFATLFEAMGS